LESIKKILVKYFPNNKWRFSKKDGRIIILNEINAASGKAFEFIFFDEVVDTYELYISNDCIRDFFTMHKYSPDFKDYWSGRMEKGEEIPVFFTLNSDQQVENIGLSYMFKYPYSKSVYNAIGDIHRCNRPDLGEIVFGSIQHNLKGRVRFSHAKLESRVNENRKTVSLILSNPRASYYPIYLQSGEWNNPGGIKGRKQYLVYNAVIPGENNNSEVQSELIPLPANYKFSSKIYYHNLNKVEFGALLSAITFHGNNDCYYNLGAAKPFGYGRVKVVIKNIMKASLESNKLEPYPKSIWLETLIRFEEEMEKKLAIDWKNSPHINNLYLMSKEIPNNKSDDFKYMRMNMDNSGKNEFLSAKKNKENLPYYADIICNKLEFVNINTLIVSAKIEEDRIALEKEKRQIEFANKRKQQEMALELGGKYFIGDEIEITVISAEKPKLGVVVGASVEVQIVTKMAIVAGNIIKCTIKQKAKDGRIVQVEY
jgi:sRNA-binding carbon storage regulator CsrA